MEVNYSKVQIGLASPEVIRSWSYGEVLKPETINYRTLRPEKDGLFCEKIFGTTRDWECFCGKFKSIRYKELVCDRCGVEIAESKVRRERMGHIELSCPVSHIWFYKAVPSRIGLLLDISILELKSIIYYEKYIVIDPMDVEELQKGELLPEDKYNEIREKYGDSSFRAGIGAEVIKDMLNALNLEEEIRKLRDKMVNAKTVDKRKMVRLSLLEDFDKSSNRPEWMIMTVIPVIPPELRPMVQLDGGRFATSDLNDLYRRLINRNNRLKKLIALKAPDIIIKNEKRMLQEAVDALFDNSRRKRTVKGAGSRPLKSLSDILKGKQGRFRQNLLGKRVDYSARSVIVVGPELKIHQCGIPKKMALELFKPFIMRKLVDKKIVYNIKSAKRLIDNEYPEVWKILEETIKGHPVILNRAPTLHRLGMQAFEPILTNEKAIRLHPLVCSAYNADFDGDQMAVHLPLSAESQVEAWTLMLSALNLLDPANGEPITNPSQDMVLGAYNLTCYKNKALGEGRTFYSPVEAEKAYINGCIELQAKINVFDNRSNVNKIVETSLGRYIFSSCFPVDFPWIDKVLTDKDLNKLISTVYKKYGKYETVVMLDKIKEISFHYSTIFANTISVEDIIIPQTKEEVINEAIEKAKQNNQDYQSGIITEEEKYQKNISLWTYVNDSITQDMMNELEDDKDGHNSLFIMATSGARGSKQQIRQLAGMRGLMAKPSGDIIDMPIISNFKEGLSVLEYFISTHGARKGLSDTALKTADAGYLTRKLVDIAQDVTVSLEDCGTISGIEVFPIKSGDEIIEKLSERVEGRFTAEEIIDPYTNEVIIPADTLINRVIALEIDRLEIEKIKIRTVVTCDAYRGICKKCYGINLSQGRLVDIGESVGIIASQSIGQPGTQLTMRTFHIGGTASSEVSDPFYKVNSSSVIMRLPDNLIRNKDGKLIAPRRGFITIASVQEYYEKDFFKTIQVKNGQSVKVKDNIGINKQGKSVKIKKNGFIVIDDKNGKIIHIGNDYQHPIKIGAIFEKDIGELILKDEIVYTFDTITEPIISEASGIIRYQDIILNKTLKEEMDEFTGIINRKIITPKEEHLQPKFIIVPKDSEGKSVEIDLPVGANIQTEDGDEVNVGDILAGRIRAMKKTTDITGGLPRVQELFEARNPINVAVIAEIDGEIEIGETRKGRRTINIHNKFGDIVKHIVPSGKALNVRTGDFVKAGEPICEGMINPHDILRVSGEVELYRFMLRSIQEVYKRQGVTINDKHIGVIIRQMLRKVEVIDPGDTAYIRGKLIDKYKLRIKNKEVIEEGGQPANVKSALLGLTKASLNTESFIASAAFQETTKVLTNMAIQNANDELRGLKENVIIGQKIPAGTSRDYYNSMVVYKDILGDIDYIGAEDE